MKQGYSNFDLGVPSGATITGIEVFVEGKSLENNDDSVIVHLSWDDGVNTVQKTLTLSTVEEIITLGNSSDLWGRAWTASEFSNANFLLIMEKNAVAGDYVYIDHIQVKVHYETDLDKQTSKTLLDATSIVDNILKHMTLVLTGSVSIIDNIYYSIIQVLSSAVAFVDTIIIIPVKKLLKILTIGASMTSTSAINKTRSDILLMSEQLAKSTSISQSDAYEIIDSLNSFIFVEQFNADAVNTIDTLLTSVGLSKTEILELIDSYSRTSAHERILNDVTVINDARVVGITHMKSDLFNFVEHIIQTRGVIASDIFDITDTEKIDTSKRLLASVLFVDQLRKSTSFSREDSFAIADTLLNTSEFYKDVIDSIDVIESISKENVLTKTEIIELTDAFSKLSEYAKSLIENPIFSETLQKNIVFRPVDSLSFAEFIKFSRMHHMTDTSSLADVLTMSSSLLNFDSFIISDDSNKYFDKYSSDNINLVDTCARAFIANRTFTESLILDESLSFAEHHLIVDLLILQEIITNACELSTSDTLIIVGEVDKQDETRVLSDSTGLIDDLTKSVSLYIIDTEDINDTFYKLSNFNLSQDEIMTIEDHFKADRFERMRKNKTLLVSSNSRNKVYLFHRMRK